MHVGERGQKFVRRSRTRKESCVGCLSPPPHSSGLEPIIAKSRGRNRNSVNPLQQSANRTRSSLRQRATRVSMSDRCLGRRQATRGCFSGGSRRCATEPQSRLERESLWQPDRAVAERGDSCADQSE